MNGDYESWELDTEVDHEISDGIPVLLGDGSSRPEPPSRSVDSRPLARLGEAWWNDFMRDQTVPAEVTKPYRKATL